MKKNLIASCLLLLLAGCTRPKESSPEAPRTVVTLAPVITVNSMRSVEVVGTLFGEEEISLSAKVAGRLGSISKDLGDPVEGGGELTRFEAVDFELAVEQSQAALDQSLARLGLDDVTAEGGNVDSVPSVEQARLQMVNAQEKATRGEQLFKGRSVISEQEFNDLKAASNIAQRAYAGERMNARSLIAEAKGRKADVRQRRQVLADTIVRAPELPNVDRFLVSARLVSSGEYVNQGAPLYRLVAIDQIKLRALVPERFAPAVSIDQAVSVSVEPFADRFSGRVIRLAPQINRENRSLEVEILISNSEHKLRPGAFARAIVTIGAEQVILVPQEAVISFAGVRKIFTVEEGKAVERIIRVGRRQGDQVEILEGLAAPAEVIVSGATTLAAGMAVEVKSSSALKLTQTAPAQAGL